MFYIIAFILIVFLLLLLSFVWPPDSPWSPWWRTSDSIIRESLRLAKVTKDDIIYDLGSGDGRVVIIAAREFGARAVGVEIDPFRYFISKLLVRLNGVSDKVKIVRKNFFDVDITGATVVFLYLVPKAISRLLPKLKKELKPGTRIISNKYKIPGGKEVLPSADLGFYIYKI